MISYTYDLSESSPAGTETSQYAPWTERNQKPIWSVGDLCDAGDEDRKRPLGTDQHDRSRAEGNDPLRAALWTERRRPGGQAHYGRRSVSPRSAPS